MNCSSDIHNLTGAYVLNAMCPAECWEFEQHVDGCAGCTREVREMRETAALLGMAVARRRSPRTTQSQDD